MHKNEQEYSLQDFIIKVQEEMERENINYIESCNKLDILLHQIGDTTISDKIRSIVFEKECTYAYETYKQGLLDGVKRGLIIANRKIPISDGIKVLQSN